MQSTIVLLILFVFLSGCSETVSIEISVKPSTSLVAGRSQQIRIPVGDTIEVQALQGETTVTGVGLSCEFFSASICFFSSFHKSKSFIERFYHI